MVEWGRDYYAIGSGNGSPVLSHGRRISGVRAEALDANGHRIVPGAEVAAIRITFPGATNQTGQAERSVTLPFLGDKTAQVLTAKLSALGIAVPTGSNAGGPSMVAACVLPQVAGGTADVPGAWKGRRAGGTTAGASTVMSAEEALALLAPTAEAPKPSRKRSSR